MAKIPYLVRRKNVFYFRLGVPVELREILKSREIIKSLKTEDSDEAMRRALKLAAHFKTILHELKTGKISPEIYFDSLISAKSDAQETRKPLETVATYTPPKTETRKAPNLSIVVDDFLKRYDPTAKAMLGKLNATLPIFVELITIDSAP